LSLIGYAQRERLAAAAATWLRGDSLGSGRKVDDRP
jgi:hypothetical protein